MIWLGIPLCAVVALAHLWLTRGWRRHPIIAGLSIATLLAYGGLLIYIAWWIKSGRGI